MKPLESYKRCEVTGMYEDDDGVSWTDLGSLLQSKVIGHCGCGCPEENLKLIYDMLMIQQEHWNKDATYEQIMTSYHEKNEKIKNYVVENWERFSDFFFYVMNDKEIMEHGGSVPGWICDNNFMEALKIWHAQYLIDKAEEENNG